MKERPILFSGAMVRAVMDERKTQTRRVMNPQPSGLSGDTATWYPNEKRGLHYASVGHFRKGVVESCPYGQPGDRLWVREAWTTNMEKDREDKRREAVRYRATDKLASSDGMGWRPSIFMPRWASRITLEITDIRVQRVQEISSTDAESEGVECHEMSPRGFKDHFRELWGSINADRGYGWDKNPWVWVISFRRI